MGGKYGQRVKCTQVAPHLTHFTSSRSAFLQELIKMKGEEIEKSERKWTQILDVKEGEIEELQRTISRKDAQLKAGETNFQKYKER